MLFLLLLSTALAQVFTDFSGCYNNGHQVLTQDDAGNGVLWSSDQQIGIYTVDPTTQVAEFQDGQLWTMNADGTLNQHDANMNLLAVWPRCMFTDFSGCYNNGYQVLTQDDAGNGVLWHDNQEIGIFTVDPSTQVAEFQDGQLWTMNADGTLNQHDANMNLLGVWSVCMFTDFSGCYNNGYQVLTQDDAGNGALWHEDQKIGIYTVDPSTQVAEFQDGQRWTMNADGTLNQHDANMNLLGVWPVCEYTDFSGCYNNGHHVLTQDDQGTGILNAGGADIGVYTVDPSTQIAHFQDGQQWTMNADGTLNQYDANMNFLATWPTCVDNQAIVCQCVADAGMCSSTCSDYLGAGMSADCQDAFLNLVCVDGVDNSWFGTAYADICVNECSEPTTTAVDTTTTPTDAPGNCENYDFSGCWVGGAWFITQVGCSAKMFRHSNGVTTEAAIMNIDASTGVASWIRTEVGATEVTQQYVLNSDGTMGQYDMDWNLASNWYRCGEWPHTGPAECKDFSGCYVGGAWRLTQVGCRGELWRDGETLEGYFEVSTLDQKAYYNYKTSLELTQTWSMNADGTLKQMDLNGNVVSEGWPVCTGCTDFSGCYIDGAWELTQQDCEGEIWRDGLTLEGYFYVSPLTGEASYNYVDDKALSQRWTMNIDGTLNQHDMELNLFSTWSTSVCDAGSTGDCGVLTTKDTCINNSECKWRHKNNKDKCVSVRSECSHYQYKKACKNNGCYFSKSTGQCKEEKTCEDFSRKGPCKNSGLGCTWSNMLQFCSA